MFKLLLRHVPLFAMLFACLSLSACKDADEWNTLRLEQMLAENSEPSVGSTAYFCNHPLPVGRKQLRVLAIGNSYTVDAITYVKDILAAADIEEDSYSVYYVAHEAATLQHWWEQAEQETELTLYHACGAQMPLKEGTMAQLLAQQWDVISLQQYSDDSVDYTTYNPWLRQLIDFIQQYCPNPDVTLAWQMPWSYNDRIVPSMPNYTRWLFIANATQTMLIEDGVNVIIPVGTAIQNGRRSVLNTAGQLTRDGWHLDYGIGRYIAACTWVETLFGPVYGFSVEGNSALPDMGDHPQKRFVSQPVTEENRPIAWKCAREAVVHPFKIME